MKKVLLIFNILTTIAIFSASAADLNPFAYGLKLDTPKNASAITRLSFSLNAPATSVKVWVIDEAGQEYLWKSYGATSAGDWGTDVFAADLLAMGVPAGQILKWRVDVAGGNSGANAVKVDNEYYFFHPTSVDVDDNPENPYFGRILCNEGYQEITSKTGTTIGSSGHAYNEYKSYTKGAGLYAFDAKFKFVGSYNGGNTFKIYRDDKTTEKGRAPHRIRISDDGRIFMTSFNGGSTWGGKLLWEVNSDDLSDWYVVFKDYTNINGYAQMLKGEYFMAAPNVGFDVKGSGKDLKLLMLSANNNCYLSYSDNEATVHAAFRCYEYDLGTAKEWTTRPSRKWFDGNLSNENGSKHKVVTYTNAQVQYDGRGGVWMCQYRNGSVSYTIPSMAYYIANDNSSTNYEDTEAVGCEQLLYRNGGGFRFNRDYSRVIISGTSAGNSTALGKATVYKVEYNNNIPVLTEECVIDMGLGANMADYAWDYADNIYAVSYSKEKLVAYALPRATKMASTPAASRYTFSVDCQSGEVYDISVNCDLNKGSVKGGVRGIASCEKVTVFAQSKEGYKFICWKEGDNIMSVDNPYTFLATKNLNLVAHFEEGDYNVTWWNLFKEGADIAHPTYDKDLNSTLWRLYQVELKTYENRSRVDKGMHIPTGKKSQFNVATFFSGNSGFETNKHYLNGVETHPTSGKVNNKMFVWLKDYLEYMNGGTIGDGTHHDTDDRLGYFLYLFMNRTDTAYDNSLNNSNCVVIGEDWGSKHEFWKMKNGVYDKSKKFVDYGKPEYWRPWWTSYACNLLSTSGSNDSLPITWNQIPCSSGNITDAADPNTVYTPSSWYKWNTAPDEQTYNESEYLLAWRDGSIEGSIVHYVYRDSMKLYATYVKKRLQENDPEPSEDYDAKNSDVLWLLNNKKYGTTLHSVEIDRKFAGNMYNTVCFPFDLHSSLFPKKLRNADVMVFTGVTQTDDESGDPVVVLNFISLKDYWKQRDPNVTDPYMEAGVPYLIKPTGDISDDYLTYSGLAYWKFFDGNHEPYASTLNDVTFKGVFNPTTITEENAYILVADNRLAKVTGNNREIKGYRGYFIINDPWVSSLADKGNVYFSFKKPVTTSVPVAPESEQQHKPEVRKIMHDGKIYILRGNEVYTITGNRVR